MKKTPARILPFRPKPAPPKPKTPKVRIRRGPGLSFEIRVGLVGDSAAPTRPGEQPREKN